MVGQEDVKVALLSHKQATGTAPHFTADEDYEPQAWSAILTSQVWSTERQQAISGGAATKIMGKPTSPAQATSVRFYAQVAREQIPTASMRQSGASSVSITAIGSDGRPVQDKALIWWVRQNGSGSFHTHPTAG